MGKKKPEDEIQQKLIELELSIKDEQTRQPPATIQPSKQLASVGKDGPAGSSTAVKIDEDSKMMLDLYNFGGIGLIIVSAVMLLGHIGLSLNWATMWGARPGMALALLPMLVGIGMLFYNYKSKIAQVVTIGSFALLFVLLITNLTFTFYGLSLLDLLILTLPLCAGFAMLAKAQVKRRELTKGNKLIE